MNCNNNRKLCSKEEYSGHLEWNFVNGNTEKWPNYYTLIYFTKMFYQTSANRSLQERG